MTEATVDFFGSKGWQLGKNLRQKAPFVQEADRFGKVGEKGHFADFIAHPFDGNARKKSIGHFHDYRKGCVVDGKLETGAIADSTDHAQFIFGKAEDRIADGSHEAPLNILFSVYIVIQCFCSRIEK